MQVRVGIIGAGIVSNARARGYLSHKSAKIAAVCDIEEERARQKAKAWGVSKTYSSYQDLLKDDDINTVDILLPHALHAQVAIAAAEAGKNIVVQKPMAMSLKEADAMIKAANDNGVKLGVEEDYIRYPPIAKAAELIQNNEIGSPVAIRIEKVAGTGGPEAWREPDDPTDWRKQKAKHGGYIYDEIVHHSAVATLLMQADVESVAAMFENVDAPDERPGAVIWKHVGRDKYGSLIYSLGRSRTQIPIATDYYPVHEGYEVIGNRGILWVTRCTGRLLNEPPLFLYRDGERFSYEQLETDWGVSFEIDVHNFVDDLINDKEPRFSAADGKKHIQFAWAVDKAAKEKRTVRLEEIN